jgi:hypothetical protein
VSLRKWPQAEALLRCALRAVVARRAQPDLRARFPTHPSLLALPIAANRLMFVVLSICCPSFGWFWSRLMFMPKLRTSERARMQWATSREVGTRQAGLNPRGYSIAPSGACPRFYFGVTVWNLRRSEANSIKKGSLLKARPSHRQPLRYRNRAA